jgi:hypothetical protein
MLPAYPDLDHVTRKKLGRSAVIIARTHAKMMGQATPTSCILHISRYILIKPSVRKHYGDAA